MASRHGIVSAEAAADLRAVRRAMDAAPAVLQRLLNATAAEQLSAGWQEELSQFQATPAQQKFVLADAEALPGPASLRVGAGRGILARVFEFGTNDREKYTTYQRQGRSGRTHSVTRRASRQVPQRKAGGYIVYPAANRLGTRVFQMWGELIHKVTHDWMEGK